MDSNYPTEPTGGYGRRIQETTLTRRALMRGGGRFAIGTAAFVGLGGVLASCSSGSGSGSGSSASGVNSAALKKIRSAVSDAQSIPAFVPPGPAIDISSAHGKKIFYLPLLMGVPIVQTWWQGVQDACSAAGLQAHNFDPQGQANLIVAGMDQAINSNVDCIIIDSIASESISAQIAKAVGKGIKVIVANERNDSAGGPADKSVSAGVSLDYIGAAQLEADWVVSDSGGNASVAVFILPNEPAHLDMVKAIRTQFASVGSGMKVASVQQVAAADWSTRLPTLTGALLSRFPDLSYIIPVVDAMALNIVPTLRQRGKIGKVRISTYNGTAGVEELVKSGAVGTDIAGANYQESWAYIDQALRLLTGHPPVREIIPNRLIDKTNINSININEANQLHWFNITQAINGYKQVWGVS
jgi:ribose transport system substrate-binding protein